MPINSFLYPGAKFIPGYEVANSCRFDDGSSDTLTRTFGSSGNQKTFTFSGWYKRSETGVEHRIFSSHNTGSPAGYASMHFHTSDDLIIFNYNGSSSYQYLRTDRKFRDLSAWYHIVLAYDTTQSTASNRVKLYINGVQETSFSSETTPSQNADLYFNDNVIHYVSGGDTANGSNPYSGYMAEIVLVDGQQLDPTSFGEFDEDSPNIWKPKNVSGLTFGTNGFYLDFENASSLGADVSGNSNNFTVNNLTSVDQSTDTCTNNFATANPLHFNATIPSANTLSNGNLTFTSSQGSGAYPAYYSTIGVTKGKWYAEFTVTTAASAMIGIGDGIPSGGFLGGSAYDYAVFHNGELYNNGSGASTGYNSYADNDVIGVALDLDNNKVYFHKNNTYMASGNPAGNSGGQSITAASSTTGGVYFFAYGDAGGSSPVISANFGSPPYSITSGNSDANGFGSFDYAVPSGFFVLNSKNLAEFG